MTHSLDHKFFASSNLNSAGYDPDTEVLEVEFLSGKTYRYKDVPPDVVEGLFNPPVDDPAIQGSHGKYFNKHIRMKYKYFEL